ncbi:MAG: type I methionyl aminopeptidase [Desulfobacterales bacterium]|nr:type I methionyl aminopeptidase [Desulfobacterales bacterium]
MNLKPTKVGRNDPCPCGSGLKYKKCCMGKEGAAQPADLEGLYARKYRIRVKTSKDIEAIRRAGRLVVDTLALVAPRIRPGITTDDINTWVHEFTVKSGAVPAPLNYRGYPKSVCVSVNEVICHGIPSQRVLKDGDIVNVDVTSILDGYYADANKTYFVGTPGPNAHKIVGVARECLRRGMELVKAGSTVGDIGWAIQTHAESQGCSVVREFVGHGIGFDFHEPPQVPHFGRKGEGLALIPGMVFTMWTAVTRDGSLSAQFEQTVLVTDNGCESLTPWED